MLRRFIKFIRESYKWFKNNFWKNKNKEELKLNIQNIFIKLRNTLNDREDELLLEIDKTFNDNYCNEDLIKKSEKLPNKIKISLERGKLIDKEWNNNELNSFINDCITIENNIQDINLINNSIKKFNSNKNIELKFYPNEEGINEILNNLKIFGQIIYKFKFKKCPSNINGNRRYTVSGENQNIFTKNGVGVYWTPGLWEYELEKNKEFWY